MCCIACSSVKLNLKSFKIIIKCKSEFHTKIHEALFIKKSISSLNRLLYVNGSSFLLSLFNFLFHFFYFKISIYFHFLNNLMKLKIGFMILFALTCSSQCKIVHT